MHHFEASYEVQAPAAPNAVPKLLQAQTELRRAQRQAQEAKLQAELLKQQHFQDQQPALGLALVLEFKLYDGSEVCKKLGAGSMIGPDLLRSGTGLRLHNIVQYVSSNSKRSS